MKWLSIVAGVLFSCPAFAQTGLPPDPGEAGKATLAGIDSDGDGVRDDVQRYIVLTYPESARIRAALTQMARVFQSSIQQADDTDASYNNAYDYMRARECLDYIMERFHGDEFSRKTNRAKNNLKAIVLNTEERSRAYVKFNAKLNGGHLRMMDRSKWKSSCRLDPDSLSN